MHFIFKYANKLCNMKKSVFFLVIIYISISCSEDKFDEYETASFESVTNWIIGTWEPSSDNGSLLNYNFTDKLVYKVTNDNKVDQYEYSIVKMNPYDEIDFLKSKIENIEQNVFIDQKQKDNLTNIYNQKINKLSNQKINSIYVRFGINYYKASMKTTNQLILNNIDSHENIIFAKKESSIPDYPVSLGLNLVASYPILRDNTNSYVIIDKARTQMDKIGFGGILIYFGYDNRYHAFDLSCPHEASKSVKLKMNSDQLGQAVCESCKSNYNIIYGCGNPTNGPSKEFLKRYKTDLKGDILTVLTFP